MTPGAVLPDTIARPIHASYLNCMSKTPDPAATQPSDDAPPPPAVPPPKMPKEIGGTKGPEPTRYGDWEHKGRCTDF
jgi:hypothetical protein